MRFRGLTRPCFAHPLRILPLLVMPLLGVALAGCGGDPNEEAQQCPKPYLLPDASSFTHYDGHGTDIANMTLTARLTDVQGACTGRLGKKAEHAHAHVVLLVGRGPAARGGSADVRYSVGVMRHGEILQESSYVQHVVFPANTDRVEVNGQEISFDLPTGKTLSGGDYHLYFWLDLSPEDLAVNRSHPLSPPGETGNAVSLAPGQ